MVSVPEQVEFGREVALPLPFSVLRFIGFGLTHPYQFFCLAAQFTYPTHIVRHFAVDGHLAWYPVDTVTDKVAVNVREHSFGAHGQPSMSFWVMIGIKFSSFSSSFLPPPLL